VVGSGGLEILNISNPNSLAVSRAPSNLVGNATYNALSNLSPGTQYFYRVGYYYNYNLTAFSNIVSATTISATPVVNAPTAVTQSAFTVNWNAASGIVTNYFLDVATDESFSTMVPGYNNLQLPSNITSQIVTGLNPGSYYIRVRSGNASGVSPNSNTVTVVTAPPNPLATPASSITASGLIANWQAVSGATSYAIDLSTDNFATFVTGYGNLNVGNSLNKELTGLTSGTPYQYRIRANNASGTSGNSNIISALTIPSAPVVSTPSSVTENSFTVLWSESLGATKYFLDVSADNSFTALTYSNIDVGNSGSYVVTGLNSATSLFVRMRAANISGISDNSSSVSATTFSPQPTIQSSSILFSNVGSNSATINFSPGSGSARLLVVTQDVPVTANPTNGTSYSANTQFGEGSKIGNGFVVSAGTSPVTITNLLPGTNYYFQLFEFNGSNGTENYNVSAANGNPRSQSTIATAPQQQPTNLAFSGQTSSSVNVSFSPAAENPSGYLVLRSVNGAPSTAPVNGTTYTIGTTIGNAVVASVGSSISFFDGGLPTGVNYFYTVYAYNGAGATSSYLTTNPLQGNIILDTSPPLVSFPVNNPTSITEGNTPLFNATATDNVSVTSVNFYYRGISRETFQHVSMTPGANNNYSVQIQSDWYDSLGLEYYVIATDQNNNTSARGTSFFARLIKPSITIPSLPTGPGLQDYRIISFPYLLTTNNDVTTVYSNVPWNDNTKAGLWWWNPATNNGLGDYDQYGKSPTLRTIDPGKGYWVITSTPATPQLTNVPAPNYSKDKLYQMNLKPGWNQIGNPYPISISWDDVITYNEALGSATFGKLNIYDGQAIREATGNTLLKAFEGGFVKNLTSSDITIQIPMPGQVKSGRKGTIESHDTSQDAWKISLHVQQSGVVNELGGFGMHPNANIGEDQFDNFNIPAFINAPELQFSEKETPTIVYSTDVVNTQQRFVWRFKPIGVEGQETQLSWNDGITLGEQQLYLYDEENLSIIDMSQVSSYTFRLSRSSSFKIYFGKDALHSIASEKVHISGPYPNPVSEGDLLTFKMMLPPIADQYSVFLQVFTLQGVTLHKSVKKLTGGLQRLEIGMNSDLPEGTYLYQVIVSHQQTQESRTGKIIKK
jgi:hypothetical protein